MNAVDVMTHNLSDPLIYLTVCVIMIFVVLAYLYLVD
jgi:hypothetical protein